MAIAALLGSGMRAAGGAMVKSGAKGLAKGMIGRRGKKAQQQQQNEVQQVDVKVVDSKPQTGNQISSMSSFLSLPSAKKIGSSGAKGISGVEEKLNLIKSLFAERFAYAKSKSRQDDIEKDRKRKEKREKELEKEENKAKKKVKSKNALPRVGLFDSIRNFIFYTFLAFLEKKFNFSQMLVKALPIILNVGKFIIDISGKILDGLATFIDFGYGLVDKTKEFVKFIGGDFALSAFEKALGAINHVMNLLFIYAMAQGALGGGFGGGKGKGGSAGARPGTGGRPKVTTTGGRGAGRPDIRNPLRERPKVTTTGGGTAGRPDIRNPIRNRPTVTTGAGKVAGEATEQITKKTAGKAVGKFIRPFVKRIPVFGALVDFVISVALGESLGRAATRATGAGIGGAAGTAIAGSLGTILGSVVPIVGNFLGGTAGAIAGGAIGGWIGDWIGGFLYDKIAGVKPVQAKSKGGVVRKYEEGDSTAVQAKSKGGIVHRYEEGGSVEEDVQKKLLKKDDVRVKEPKIDTEKGRGLSRVGDSAALSFVEKSGKAFSKVPIIGPILALAADKLLGNETDPNAFQAISNSLTNFSMLSSDGETKSSGDYEKFIMKYNSGGEVKASGLGLNDPMETSRSLGRFLQTKFNALTLPDAQKSTGAQGEGEYDSATGAYMGGSGKASGSDRGTATGSGSGGITSGGGFETRVAKLLEDYEGLRTEAYPDPATKAKPYTIGIGATRYPPGFRLSGEVKLGDSITKEEAYEIKAHDIKRHTDIAISEVGSDVWSKLPDNVKAALVSKAFNYGSLQETLSGLVKTAASSGNYQPIADYFRNTLAAHNGGINSWRRNDEAGIIEGGMSARAGISFPKSAAEAQIAYAPESAKIGPGADPAADVQRGDPSQAASRLLQDFPQIKSRANSQQVYASGLGYYLKKSGAGEGGKGDFGNPPGGDMEHPDHGGVVASHRGQGHYKGQALDLGGNSATSSAYRDDQKQLWPFVVRFLKKYGLDQDPTVPQTLHGQGESFSPVGPGGGPDGGHNDHLHVEFQGGGLIGKSTKQYGDISTKASYEKTGSKVMIQPVIIEKQAPQDNFMMNPMDKLTFAGRARVNNTTAFSRG